MEYPVNVHMTKNEITVSWEEDSVLCVFYVELGKILRAGYQTSAGENLKIHSGSKDNDALISAVIGMDLTLLLVKQRRVNRTKAYNIVLRYYREIKRNINNPMEIKTIVRKFRNEILGILGIEN